MRFGVIVAASIAVGLAAGTADADEIALGVSAPSTGFASVLGQGIVDGARLAVDQINSQGGVSGKKLHLFVYDDQCDAGQAVSGARRMVLEDKVSALIGYPCGATSLAASAVARESNRLLIAASGALSVTDAPASPVLHMLTDQVRLANTVADYIRNNFPNKSVGLWYQAGNFFTNKLQQSIQSRNIKLIGVDASPGGSQPSWLGAADVVVTSQSSASSLVAPSTNSKLNIVVPAAVLSSQLVEVVRRRPGIVALTDPPAEYFSGAAQVLARARNTRADTAGYFIYSYASVQVFAEAARRAPSLSGDALFKAATQSPIETAIGTRIFDDKGSIQGINIIGTMKSGETIASVDFCRRQDCHNYVQCPSDCPK